jgi:uncharacterized protein YdbL (DUF1318 family)
MNDQPIAPGVAAICGCRLPLGAWPAVRPPARHGRTWDAPAPVLLFCVAALLLAPRAGRGQEADLKVSTPAIMKLRESMAAHAAQIAKLKDFGQLGEGRDGLLAVRSLTGLDLAKKKEVEDLVAAENADRRGLYREILVANGLRDEDAPRVMALAARARRAEAAPGHYVQDPASGAWILQRDLKE